MYQPQNTMARAIEHSFEDEEQIKRLRAFAEFVAALNPNQPLVAEDVRTLQSAARAALKRDE
mgnify:CR=1 FL=1